jgi:hypothetical protein
LEIRNIDGNATNKIVIIDSIVVKNADEKL